MAYRLRVYESLFSSFRIYKNVSEYTKSQKNLPKTAFFTFLRREMPTFAFKKV